MVRKKEATRDEGRDETVGAVGKGKEWGFWARINFISESNLFGQVVD